MINSFDLTGAATLVDPLNASSWCETLSEDRDNCSEVEGDSSSSHPPSMHTPHPGWQV